MRIYRGFLYNLGIPIKELRTGCRRIPAIEDIASLCRIRSRFLRLLVLFYCLRIRNRRTAIRVKGDRKARRNPPCIENQVVARHLIKGILLRKLRIRVPTTPSIVCVHTCRSCGNVIILGRIDVCLVVNIGLRGQLCRAVIVVDLILSAIIIEMIAICTAIIAVNISITRCRVSGRCTTMG